MLAIDAALLRRAERAPRPAALLLRQMRVDPIDCGLRVCDAHGLMLHAGRPERRELDRAHFLKLTDEHARCAGSGPSAAGPVVPLRRTRRTRRILAPRAPTRGKEMFFVCDREAVLQAYGQTDGDRVLQAVQALGQVIDASGLTASEIRARIAAQPPGPACLVGGYRLLPTFRMPNPSRAIVTSDDADVLTDAPYGARVGSDAECYLPSRPVSRLPDAGSADAFVALLERAAAAPAQATPPGCFQQAAAEFRGSALHVHGVLGDPVPPRQSPPDDDQLPGLLALITGRGRLQLLLHGARTAKDRDTLWGRGPQKTDPFVRALSAPQLLQCNLAGSVVSFSSCYAAMLDSEQTQDGPRTPDNQVALACLAAGAKAVFGATRANWIDISDPFDDFSGALAAFLWKRLQAGTPAAEALRAAKRDYATMALARDGWSRPYVLKTLLQSHCYAHPLAGL